jgi:hypothetical protein
VLIFYFMRFKRFHLRTGGDYAGLDHLEAKDVTPCGCCILVRLHIRDFRLQLVDLSVATMCTITYSLPIETPPFYSQRDITTADQK